MTLNEWTTNQQPIWNKLTNENIKNYLIKKYGHLNLLLAEDAANNYFEFQLLNLKNTIGKIEFLESEYQKIWDKSVSLSTKTTAQNENSNNLFSVGYGATNPVPTGTANDSSTATNEFTNVLEQLDKINNWIMELYPLTDKLVNGMCERIKGVSL